MTFECSVYLYIHIQILPLRFPYVHIILVTNILFTFIYELIGLDLTDNEYINILVFGQISMHTVKDTPFCVRPFNLGNKLPLHIYI